MCKNPLCKVLSVGEIPVKQQKIIETKHNTNYVEMANVVRLYKHNKYDIGAIIKEETGLTRYVLDKKQYNVYKYTLKDAREVPAGDTVLEPTYKKIKSKQLISVYKYSFIDENNEYYPKIGTYEFINKFITDNNIIYNYDYEFIAYDIEAVATNDKFADYKNNTAMVVSIQFYDSVISTYYLWTLDIYKDCVDKTYIKQTVKELVKFEV